MNETDKFYPVSYIAKEDLLDVLPDEAERIEALSDADMSRIAEKFGDALQEYYWTILQVVLGIYLEKPSPDEHSSD